MSSKKLFAVFALIISLVCLPAMNCQAATKKNRAKSSSSANAIGSFIEDGETVTLLSNGKIKSTNKCTTGEYKKQNGYYQISLWTKNSPRCGDGGWQYVIVGNKVYFLYGGSDNSLDNYTVNTNDGTLTKLDFDPEWDPESIGMESATVSLDFFPVVATFKSK